MRTIAPPPPFLLFSPQQGPVRYFYCSTKVFKAYSGEGLTKDPRMAFQNFMETEFFQRACIHKEMVEEKRPQEA
ncbi:uncharacterized protein LOC113072108 [Tachysurus ichikawai]